jgi:hypothetical protein
VTYVTYVTNTLAYYVTELITAVKTFMVKAVGVLIMTMAV